MIASLTWEPWMPVWLIALSVTAAAVLCVGLTMRGSALGLPLRLWLLGCRLAALAVLTIILLGPTATVAVPDSQARREVAVLFDASASMADTDVAPTRYRRAADAVLADAVTASLGRAADVTYFALDDGASPSSVAALHQLEPIGRTTPLVEAVTSLIENAPADRRAIIIVSDGHDSQAAAGDRETDNAVAQAVAKGIALIAVPVGAADEVPDTGVSLRARRSGLFDGEEAVMAATVRQSGLRGRSFRLTLRADGEIVDTIHAQFAPGESVRRLVLRHTPQMPEASRGTHRTIDYAASLEPQGGEANTDNNTAHALVKLNGRRIAALLLEGEPHWDTRFVSKALSGDPQVVLTTLHAVTADHVIMTSPGEDGETDEAITLPISDRMLERFDVLVLGRGMQWFFPGKQAAALDRFVTQHGGGIVFVRGQPYDADEAVAKEVIAPLLPDEGDTLLRVIRRVAPDGRGAAEAVRMHAGAGRTLTVRTADLWRWAMSDDATGEYPASYRNFVGRCVRWAAVGDGFVPSESLSISVDRTTAMAGEARTVQVRVREPGALPAEQPAILKVIDPAGQTSDVALTSSDDALELSGVFTPVVPGVYELAMGDSTIGFVATDSNAERADVSANPQLLAYLADRTGGTVVPLEQIDTLGECIGSLGSTDAPAVRTDTQPAWDRAWLFAILVGALALEWASRRGAGLA